MIKDEFLTSIFGHECWNLGSDVGFGLMLWRQQGSLRRFGFAKVAVGQEAVLGDLLAHNFRVIETQVVFKSERKWAATPHERAHKPYLRIRPMTSTDSPFIEELAARSFGNSRFHRDMKIPKSIADEIKRQWGKNLAVGSRPSDGYVCLDVNQSIVGFISLVEATHCPDLHEFAIDLIAVDAAHQQMGVGRLLLNHAQTVTREKKATLLAGTQASNDSAIKLYQRNGMNLYSASYVLHAHEPFNG